MAVKEKKKTKQKGGLSGALSTIFRVARPKKNNQTIIRTTTNEILSDYFSKIFELLERLHNQTEIKNNINTFTEIIDTYNTKNILFNALLVKLRKNLRESINNRKSNILEIKKDFIKLYIEVLQILLIPNHSSLNC
jgi:type I site-specific restriction-modification system R (restriction) subunit